METKKEEVIRLLNSKRIAEAKELLEEMIIGSPEDTFVLYNLGMCYSELGNYHSKQIRGKRFESFNPEFIQRS
jgi:tetratricopeptide (TPR) repeat protein